MTDLSPFLRPIAHRGLHDAARGVVENTGDAFAAAIAGGYGIECDVRPGAGGAPLVFHDETLDRLVEGSGRLADVDAGAVVRLRHRIGGAGILSFTELIKLVDGRVPLLVEIKSEWEPADERFLAAIGRQAAAYDGAIALMSFDPSVMMQVHVLAPGVPWGLVSGSYKSCAGDTWWADKLPPDRAARLRDLAEPCHTADASPDFYAYEVDALPTAATEAARAAGKPVLTWTVRTPEQVKIAEKHADAMIFEGFLP